MTQVPSIEEIRNRDTSEEFLQIMQAYASDISPAVIHDFQTHMINAALMSHYKYGWVEDKSYTHYKKLSTFEGFGFAKDKNLEHQINIANYAMFRYITMPIEGIVYPAPEHLAGKGLKYEPSTVEYETPEDLVNIAVEALRRYANPQGGEHYQGTDSDKSVVKAKPKSVTQHLYDKFASAYDYYNEKEPFHFNIYTM